MKNLFADIVLPLPVQGAFTYALPERLREQVKVGTRVLVSFSGRRRIGFVVRFREQVEGTREIKEVLEVPDGEPVFDEAMAALTQWIAGYYLCSWGEALKCALPAGVFSEGKRRVVLKEPYPEPLIEKLLRRAPRQAEVLRVLADRKAATLDQLRRMVGKEDLYGVVHQLARKGYVEVLDIPGTPRIKVKRERTVRLAEREGMDEAVEELERRAPKQAACLKILIEREEMPAFILSRDYGIGPGSLKGLEQKGWVRISWEEKIRDPFKEMSIEEPKILELTPAQRDALDGVKEAICAGTFRTVLLYGITGSGKTQVYIEAIAKTLAMGRSAIVLVPEISLTPQTVRRFRAHFGDEVAVLHSGLSGGERYDAWRMIRRGERKIVVGARSAVFAPLDNLGLIVVDEEHESTYKQYDTTPRYHARDVATVRARDAGAVVILGSATPSLESYRNAQAGKFALSRLPERIDDRRLPEVEIVDMRKEKEAGNWSFFSNSLKEGIAERLERKEQVILLQNRRGYASFIQCPDCGHAFHCPHCQVTLTYHASGRWLICHYCGLRRRAPSICPECHGHRLKYRGIGTERVEAELETLFPEARIVRMDRDTTGTKGAHYRLLERFRKKEADILLGTQMVAKGLDFAEVTLVGVISADTALNLPDFRAGERTFQLLTQVAGRTGRGDRTGWVIIQTYNPDDEAIRFARRHDFEGYAKMELANREELGYPPFGKLVRMLFRSKSEEAVQRISEQYGTALRKAVGGRVEVLGPVEAPMSRIKDYYRWHLLLRGKGSKSLRTLAMEVHRTGRADAKNHEVIVTIDVDPAGML
ncbi:MAG: primosomal protein N', partial [Candidatus Latescibacteria bacterium]|nr:primosomal protein N' [Candidatus Latescibacterota bacterium]